MNRIVVHVDRLVLKGFESEDRDAFAESLRVELGRRFAEPDSLRTLANRRDVARVSAPALSIPSAAGPAQTGTSVARAVARSLKS